MLKKSIGGGARRFIVGQEVIYAVKEKKQNQYRNKRGKRR